MRFEAVSDPVSQPASSWWKLVTPGEQDMFRSFIDSHGWTEIAEKRLREASSYIVNRYACTLSRNEHILISS